MILKGGGYMPKWLKVCLGFVIGIVVSIFVSIPTILILNLLGVFKALG